MVFFGWMTKSDRHGYNSSLFFFRTNSPWRTSCGRRAARRRPWPPWRPGAPSPTVSAAFWASHGGCRSGMHSWQVRIPAERRRRTSGTRPSTRRWPIDFTSHSLVKPPFINGDPVYPFIDAGRFRIVFFGWGVTHNENCKITRNNLLKTAFYSIVHTQVALEIDEKTKRKRWRKSQLRHDE